MGARLPPQCPSLPMNYIGSKRSLLAFLSAVILREAGGPPQSFCDLFAGTGCVGAHFKQLGYDVVGADLQFYSYVLNKHLLENNGPLSFSELSGKLPVL